jgi:hypothetical protein
LRGQFVSPQEVLNEVARIHPELTNMVIPILEQLESSRKQHQDKDAVARSTHLALKPENVVVETLNGFLRKYSPLQLLSDRNSAKKFHFNRRVYSACICMQAATSLVRRAEKAPGKDLADRVLSLLSVDQRSPLPHPQWTLKHDAILIGGMEKHGWIDRDNSCRAIMADETIKWGPPFDLSDAEVSGNQEMAPVAKGQGLIDEETACLRSTALRASHFLNSHRYMLKELKSCNQQLLVDSYGLKQQWVEGGEEGDEPVSEWIVDEKILLQSSVPSVGGSDSDEKLAREPLDLPIKKDLAKRAKAVLLKSISVLNADGAPTGKPNAASMKADEQPGTDHGFSVIDQGDRCCILLAEILRGIVKGSQKKTPNQVRTLCSIASEEVAELQKIFLGSSHPKAKSKAEEMDKISQQIALVKRSLKAFVRPAKNVCRVMLGEEPVPSKTSSETEIMFPSSKPIPTVSKPKEKSAAGVPTVSKPKEKNAAGPPASKTKENSAASAAAPKEVIRRDDGASGERAVIRAMKKANDKNDGTPCTFTHENETETGLQLTMIETLILYTFCSEGIPVNPERQSALDVENAAQARVQKYSLSWEGIGNMLELGATEFYEMAIEKQKKAQAAVKKLNSQGGSAETKADAVAKLEIAQHDVTMKEAAASQAAAFASQSEKLAKKR